MARISNLLTLALTAMLLSSVNAIAQTAGGSGAGASAGGSTGAPAAGAAGAGNASTSGVPPGPANPGGLNNTLNDPSGQGNAARVGTQTPGTNAAGTANSSGSTSTGAGNSSGSTTAGASGTVRTGNNNRVTSGVSVTGPNRTGDVNLDAEDRAVDKKIKSICKGC